LESVPELLLGKRPVPIKKGGDPRQQTMSFSKLGIDRKCFQGRFPRFGHNFPWGSRIAREIQSECKIAICQTDISQRITRFLLDRLLKEINCFFHVDLRPLAREVPALHVKIVGFRILRVALGDFTENRRSSTSALVGGRRNPRSTPMTSGSGGDSAS